jgi:F0F1-type ATP synthase membrane subunit b/b'
MKSKAPLFLLLAGYISSLVVYQIWYYTIWPYSPNEKNIVVAVVGITALYLFLYFLILSVRSLQTPRKSFFLISIITLLTFFLIPSVYYVGNQFRRGREKIYSEKKRKKEIEAKLNNAIEINDAANKSIADLQAKLESKRKEIDKLRKQLNETIRKTKSLDEGHKTKRDVVIQAKSNKDFSKTNSEAGNTDLDSKNQGIIFKVQIISSSTRLATNSPRFKGLKNVWEYKDSSLYKYTVGNQIDLKSASKLQSEFRRKGFNGAFVVAFKNGKRIPVKEALKLLN